MKGKLCMNLVVLVLAAALPAASAQTSAAEERNKTAPAALEAMKSLEGTWEGLSKDGVPSRTRFEVIAKGTAMVETTEFEAHPDESMVTVYHADGESVLLTHYCIAGNQPRMRLAGFDPATRTARFEFLDGANIPNRDTGHMDSAVFTLTDADHFTTKWSWYQAGKEKWSEELTYSRVRD